MQLNLTQLGRILYALPMAVFGIDHFVKAQDMKNLVPAFIPGDIFWVYLTGVALLAAALSIIIKKQVWWSTLLLSLMLLGFIATIHIPGIVNGYMPTSLINLLKDISLIGGAMYIGECTRNSVQN